MVFGTGNDLPEEAYTYYLTNPLYLNDVYQYVKTAYLNQLSIINHFNMEAKVLDVKNLKHYIGTYQLINNNKEETFMIKERQGQLIYSWEHEYGTDTDPFFPSTNDKFIIGDRFGKLIRNENNEITGLIRTLGGYQPKEYKKIDND